MPEQNCGKCGGTGWVITEHEGLSGAEHCQCYGQRLAIERQNRVDIPKQFENAGFENFELPSDNPTVRTALSTVFVGVRRYVREFPLSDKPGLLLVGPVGTGKTHLAVAALKELVSKGINGVYFDYQDLLGRIMKGWNASAGASEKEAYRTAIETDVVVIDDLGARRADDWVEDTITAIITHRYNHRKALIVTTNLPDTAFGDSLSIAGQSGMPSRYKRSLSEVIGERSTSRLLQMCHVMRMPSMPDQRASRR